MQNQKSSAGRIHSQTFRKNYLKVTAVVIAAFGPVFFLGTMSETVTPAEFTLDFLGWPLDGVQTYNDPTKRFLSALTGGFLLGWGVMVYMLSGKVYDGAPEAVRKAVMAGILTWFLVDSLGSYLSGNPSNVFFNTLVLLVGIGPQWVKAHP
jgi:biotin transporter BioY